MQLIMEDHVQPSLNIYSALCSGFVHGHACVYMDVHRVNNLQLVLVCLKCGHHGCR